MSLKTRSQNNGIFFEISYVGRRLRSKSPNKEMNRMFLEKTDFQLPAYSKKNVGVKEQCFPAKTFQKLLASLISVVNPDEKNTNQKSETR